MMPHSGHGERSGDGALIPPVYGSATVMDEDRAACSFGPEDVRHLITAAEIRPIPGLALEDIAGRLRDAVQDFIFSWRWATSSPPGEQAKWARKAAGILLLFLEIMHADPDTGAWPGGIDFDVFNTLLRPDRGDIRESPKAIEVREAMGRRPLGLPNNIEVQDLVEELWRHPDVFIPLPGTALDLALRGAAYVHHLATASAEYFETLKGRNRQALTAVDGFVDDLNAIYRAISGKEGTVTTDAYEDGHPRSGAVIGFTRAVMRRTAELLPEKPALPGDVRMRKELQGLAESESKIADRIRKVRKKARPGKP